MILHGAMGDTLLKKMMCLLFCLLFFQFWSTSLTAWRCCPSRSRWHRSWLLLLAWSTTYFLEEILWLWWRACVCGVARSGDGCLQVFDMTRNAKAHRSTKIDSAHHSSLSNTTQEVFIGQIIFGL